MNRRAGTTDHDRIMSVRSDSAVKAGVSQRFLKVALETLRGGTKSLACFECFDENSIAVSSSTTTPRRARDASPQTVGRQAGGRRKASPKKPTMQGSVTIAVAAPIESREAAKTPTVVGITNDVRLEPERNHVSATPRRPGNLAASSYSFGKNTEIPTPAIE